MMTSLHWAQRIGIYPIVYTVGLGLGGYLRYQRSRGRLLVVNNEELFAPRPGGTLILANHPSIMEPWVLLGLYARQYLSSPTGMPWSTPDLRNFVDHWYGRWILVRTIPVSRGDRVKAQEWVACVAARLQCGETVIVFPEGGRTRSIKKGEKHKASVRTGRVIRPFKCHRLLDALPSDAHVLPVWVEREWDNRPDVSHGIPDGIVNFKKTVLVVGQACRKPADLRGTAAAAWAEGLVLDLADTLPRQEAQL